MLKIAEFTTMCILYIQYVNRTFGIYSIIFIIYLAIHFFCDSLFILICLYLFIFMKPGNRF